MAPFECSPIPSSHVAGLGSSLLSEGLIGDGKTFGNDL